jgi:hypothetical protein
MATQTAEFTYSEVFKNIKPEAVAITKELIKSGIWKKEVSNEDKAIYMGIWVQKMSQLYGMETPKFYFVGGKEGKREYNRTGGGCYFPTLNEMYVFKKPSLTTLLHEFRHAMQEKLDVKEFRKNKEEDARAWSVSLYKLAAPNSYKKAVAAGIMHFK